MPFSNCSYIKATTMLPDARSSAVFAGTFVVAYVVWKFTFDTRKRGNKLPPTICSLPFIGSILFLPDFRIWHCEFLKMSAKIGNVFAYYAGSRYVPYMSDDGSLSCVPTASYGALGHVPPPSLPLGLHIYASLNTTHFPIVSQIHSHCCIPSQFWHYPTLAPEGGQPV